MPDASGTARLGLGVAYDGTDFHGFAAQPGRPTVAGALADALATVLALAEPPRLTCAGRTDAGVHALGQVVHADLPAEALSRWASRPGEADAPASLPQLAAALAKRLGPQVSVWSALLAPGFDARHDARSRRYRYDIEAGGGRDPRRARVAWQLDGELDLGPMRLGCDPLVGEHDFAAFCRRPPDRPDGPLTRRVLAARWSLLRGPGLDGEVLRFEIEALAFCHQMVRSIVGLLVAIGRGRARPSDVAERLASGLRLGNPAVAPPQGLCLAAVDYPEPWGVLARPPGMR